MLEVPDLLRKASTVYVSNNVLDSLRVVDLTELIKEFPYLILQSLHLLIVHFHLKLNMFLNNFPNERVHLFRVKIRVTLPITPLLVQPNQQLKDVLEGLEFDIVFELLDVKANVRGEMGNDVSMITPLIDSQQLTDNDNTVQSQYVVQFAHLKGSSEIEDEFILALS